MMGVSSRSFRSGGSTRAGSMRGMLGAFLHQCCPHPRHTAQAAPAAALQRASSTVFPKR